ncbi:hypothetical protein CsSME_00020895 [Camellia sinensis var. sinensis]
MGSSRIVWSIIAMSQPRKMLQTDKESLPDDESYDLNARLPVLLSVDEGLVVSALGTTGRMYTAKLLDGSWVILKRVLCQKKVPNPESYLAKIYERWTTRVMTRSSPWLESTKPEWVWRIAGTCCLISCTALLTHDR